jgi:hypothetical protein
LGRWSVEIAWSIDSNGVVSVYRGGAFQRSTRLGQLSAALAWTPDGRMYAASPYRHGFRHHESLRAVCLPVEPLRRLQLHPDAVCSHRQKLIGSWTFGSTTYYLYNVTYRGVMNLTYNGRPAALDAFYGWYYMLTSYTPPPPRRPQGPHQSRALASASPP